MPQKANLFDKRVVNRNMDKGLINQKDIDEYLKALPDMESESELLVLDSEELEELENAEEPQAEDQALNFDAPEENQGPKNVYDF